MTLETVQVQARWRHEGKMEPSQFMWNGKLYRVESVGRSWEDAEGLHVLCMVGGGTVYELIFQLNPAGWHLRPTAGKTARA